MIYKNEILLSQVQFSYFCLNFSIMKISIDHNSAIPLYLQIENQLRNIIREPEYKKGKMLPNETIGNFPEYAAPGDQQPGH